MDIKSQTSNSLENSQIEVKDLKTAFSSVLGQMEVLLLLQHPLDLLLSPFLILSQSLKQMKVNNLKINGILIKKQPMRLSP